MRAYLIDPMTKTVGEVQTSGDWRDVKRLIGDKPLTTVTLNGEGDTLYLDDEGLFRPNQSFFALRNYESVLAGLGLVLGATVEGESRDVQMTLDALLGRVRWQRLAMRFSHMETREGYVEHPILGRVMSIAHVPAFHIQGVPGSDPFGE